MAYNCKREQVMNQLTAPLSATESVLLKYCSSTIQAVSLLLLVTPQKPWQFTLISAGIIHRTINFKRRELKVPRMFVSAICLADADHSNQLFTGL